VPFPKYLLLGRTSRPTVHSVKASTVRTAADLPARLFMGDLEPATFVRNGHDWSAKYVDTTPGTWSEVSYKDGLLSVNQSFRGTIGPALYRTTKDDLTELLRAHTDHPREWDLATRARLQSQYNLTYLEVPGCISGFPDGYLRTIVCPVPFWRLPDTLEVIPKLDQDTAIRAPVGAQLVFGVDGIAYWPSRCPDIPNDPLKVYWSAIQDAGFPPVNFQLDAETNSFWLTRVRYILVVGCAYRDLDRVVARLSEAAFIGTNMDGNAYLDKTEWQAVVGPAGFEYLRVNIELSDSRQPPSRVLSWQHLIDEETQSLIAELIASVPSEQLVIQGAEAVKEITRSAADVKARAEATLVEQIRLAAFLPSRWRVAPV